MANTKSLSNDLQDNLRAAMAVELTTMPPYLYAYWSIKPMEDGGTREGQEVARIIMSVVVEEMLHMALVANVLNSLGGTPAITTPPYIPTYPGSLLRHSKGKYGFEVYLRPLSLPAIDVFLKIEQPETATNQSKNAVVDGWNTIGEFYQEVEAQLKAETTDQDYSGERQLPTYDNPGPGTLIQVKSLNDALAALELIVDQGEGLSEENHNDGDHELAHYWKFKQIQDNILLKQIDLDASVYNVIPDPFSASYNAEQVAANHAFNIGYSKLLDYLQETLTSPTPDVFYQGTGLMKDLTHLAALLRNTGFVEGTQYLPGPTFEYIPSPNPKSS